MNSSVFSVFFFLDFVLVNRLENVKKKFDGCGLFRRSGICGGEGIRSSGHGEVAVLVWR